MLALLHHAYGSLEETAKVKVKVKFEFEKADMTSDSLTAGDRCILVIVSLDGM